MIRRAPLDPPRRLAKLAERAVRSAEQLVEPDQRLFSLGARLHRRPLFGELGFLPGFGRQRPDFAGGMLQPIAIPLRRLRRRPRFGQFGRQPRNLGPGVAD